MSKVNKLEFVGKDSDGNEVAVVVKRPNAQQLREAQIYQGRVVREAISNKSGIPRSKIDDYMRSEGLWDDEKQKRLEDLDDKLLEGERKLASGGIKLSEARDLALEMRTLRYEKLLLLSQRNELDQFSIEGQAENARFDYLVSTCLRDESGEPLFSSVENYLEKADQPYASEGAAKLSSLLGNYDPDWEKKLPEVKFLLQFQFYNEDLQLVDKEGNLVDKEGNRVDKYGRRVDGDGNLLDKNGNKFDSEGRPIVEFTPFLHDDGSEVVTEKVQSETEVV